MCTYINEKARILGSAKGPSGWVKVDTANVYFDHPYHAPLDHVHRAVHAEQAQVEDDALPEDGDDRVADLRRLSDLHIEVLDVGDLRLDGDVRPLGRAPVLLQAADEPLHTPHVPEATDRGSRIRPDRPCSRYRPEQP